MLFCAFFAFPFQILQCSRSTSVTITAFAVTSNGLAVVSAPAICLRCHSDMKPVENWRFGDSGIGENASKSRTSIGEGRQFGAFRSTDGIEGPADERRRRIRSSTCTTSADAASLRSTKGDCAGSAMISHAFRMVRHRIFDRVYYGVSTLTGRSAVPNQMFTSPQTHKAGNPQRVDDRNRSIRQNSHFPLASEGPSTHGPEAVPRRSLLIRRGSRSERAVGGRPIGGADDDWISASIYDGIWPR